MNDLRYPIGPFRPKPSISDDERIRMIDQISATPALVSEAVRGLDDGQLDTPYRPEGWTIRQVVHHLADSHMNSYMRFKLTLTENQPTIRAYDQKLWAELPEARSGPVDVSLALLDALHKRWVLVLKSLTAHDFAKTLNHPESGILNLDHMLQLYSWHGTHHTAHITELRKRKGW